MTENLTEHERTLTAVVLSREIRRMHFKVMDGTILLELRESFRSDRDILFTTYKKLGGMLTFEQLTSLAAEE